MSKLAIVGASGLVGRNLLEQLQKREFKIDEIFLLGKKSISEVVQQKTLKDMVPTMDGRGSSTAGSSIFSSNTSIIVCPVSVIKHMYSAFSSTAFFTLAMCSTAFAKNFVDILFASYRIVIAVACSILSICIYKFWRSITADYLRKLHYDSQEQLYDNWLATWNQQLGHLTVYQRYQSLQIAMEKGSPA